MKHLSFIVILMFIGILSGCKQSSDRRLTKSEMEDVLYDYHLAQYMTSSLPYDQRFKAFTYIQSVFKKHGITEAQFDSSLVYYNRHTDDIKYIYDRVQKRLEAHDADLRLLSGNNDMRANFTLGGDTADIWSGPKMLVLRSNSFLNKEAFTINADTSFYINDYFKLVVDFDFIREDQNNTQNSLTACLAIHFMDGKSISNVKSSSFQSHFELTLEPHDRKEIKSISGFFMFQNQQRNTRTLGIIRNISLYRFHTTKESQVIFAQSTGTDSLKVDSATFDSVTTITPEATEKREHGKRLNPDELREISIDEGTDIKIKTAPDVRTPNSIGPRRRNRKTNNAK